MPRTLAALLLLLPFSFAAYSTTVYKTVDEHGVVSFSDLPPKGEVAAEILQITTSQPQSPEEHLARLEAMREATERLASDRREREKHRAELREIRARTESYQVPEQPDYSRYADYYPLNTRSYNRRPRPPYRPIHRPKPEHPIARPPMRPGNGGSGSSNAQLMRPLVSTRP
jgi:hypothetical protein